MKITAVKRPFILTFRSSGQSYPLTADEAQRLLDAYPPFKATSQRVELHGHNSDKAYDRTVLQPATRGGGPAFVIDAEEMP